MVVAPLRTGGNVKDTLARSKVQDPFQVFVVNLLLVIIILLLVLVVFIVVKAFVLNNYSIPCCFFIFCLVCLFVLF